MKKTLFTLSLAIATTFAATAQKMTINSEKAKVEYKHVKEDVTGTVTGIKGEIDFNAKDPSKSTISGTIDVSTLVSGNKMRDEHLQKSDMFNAAKFPTMDFKSSSISKTDKGYLMKGAVTIKGTTKDVEVPFTFNDGTFKGTMVVFTNDFDVKPEKKREDSKILVRLTVPVK